MIWSFAFKYVSAPSAYSTHRGQKKVSDLLEVKLQMTVSHHMVLGSLILWRENSARSCWVISLTQALPFLNIAAVNISV